MFGGKKIKHNISVISSLACQDYLRRVIEDCPSENELEDRALYLTNALNQTRGMEYLAKYQSEAIEDNTMLIPIAGLLSKLEEMIEFNLIKLTDKGE